MKNLCYFTIILLFGACGNTKEPLQPPPNFVIFIADDVSWNDFGCYGNQAVHTPTIDALAEEGIIFNNAFLTASSCSPSRVSIMTGRYPHNTGAPELHMPLPKGIPTIGEELQKADYFTGASGKWHLGEAAKADFDMVLDSGFGQGGEERWNELVDSIPKDQPFFLWLASIDAHRNWGENRFEGSTDTAQIHIPPYMLDDGITRKDFAHYYDEITRFDHYIAEVIAQLEQQNQLNNTILIVMADNGRPFPRDKTRLYDSGIQTPFIVHWMNDKKEQAGTFSDALISAIDIAPTLSDLAGIEIAASYQGRSFKSVLLDTNMQHREYVFAEHNWHDYAAHGRMIRSKDYLYIENNLLDRRMSSAADVHGGASFQMLVNAYQRGTLNAAQMDNFVAPRPAIEFYDCANDPFQLRNLTQNPTYQEAIAQMKNDLDTWKIKTGDTFPDTLTKDRYDFFTAKSNATDHHFLDISRGEIAGAAKDATAINSNDSGF